jgi:hypothetical protein
MGFQIKKTEIINLFADDTRFLEEDHYLRFVLLELQRHHIQIFGLHNRVAVLAKAR